MEPDKYCIQHKSYYAPNEGCEKCTAERRALYREAYMAAITGQCYGRPNEESIVGAAREIALETVRQWDAMMAELDREEG